MSKVQSQEIYGLFSIANDYYQPDNNLVVLWGHVHSFQEVQKKELSYGSLIRRKLIWSG